VNKILDLIFGKFPDWLNRCAARMEQKANPKTSEPAKQEPKKKESLTWEQLNANRQRTIKIMGKDVPIKKGDSIY